MDLLDVGASQQFVEVQLANGKIVRIASAQLAKFLKANKGAKLAGKGRSASSARPQPGRPQAGRPQPGRAPQARPPQARPQPSRPQSRAMPYEEEYPPEDPYGYGDEGGYYEDDYGYPDEGGYVGAIPSRMPSLSVAVPMKRPAMSAVPMKKAMPLNRYGARAPLSVPRLSVAMPMMDRYGARAAIGAMRMYGSRGNIGADLPATQWFGPWTLNTADAAWALLHLAGRGNASAKGQLDAIRNAVEKGDGVARYAQKMLGAVGKFVTDNLPPPSVVADQLGVSIGARKATKEEIEALRKKQKEERAKRAAEQAAREAGKAKLKATTEQQSRARQQEAKARVAKEQKAMDARTAAAKRVQQRRDEQAAAQAQIDQMQRQMEAQAQQQQMAAQAQQYEQQIAAMQQQAEMNAMQAQMAAAQMVAPPAVAPAAQDYWEPAPQRVPLSHETLEMREGAIEQDDEDEEVELNSAGQP